jgi:hypothetical protein
VKFKPPDGTTVVARVLDLPRYTAIRYLGTAKHTAEAGGASKRAAQNMQ